MSKVRSSTRAFAAVAVLCGAVMLALPANARNRTNARSLASPQQAATPVLLEPSHRRWILSGDRVQDMQRLDRFAAGYAQKSTITDDGDAKALLSIGNDDFPFAFPIATHGDTWSFDAEAGREEVLNRTIGRNALDTIQTLMAVVDETDLGPKTASLARRITAFDPDATWNAVDSKPN